MRSDKLEDFELDASGALHTPLLLAARLGYAARGFVYLNIGLLALAAAMDTGAGPRGVLGAVTPIAEAPAGRFWVVVVAVGLGCFSVWRGIQAVLDPDRSGRSLKGLAKRAGQGISALIYGGLSWTLLEMLDETEDLAGADERKADAQADFLLGLPFGELLLIGLGVSLVAAGLLNALHGLSGKFQSGLDCSRRLTRLAKPIGRAGYIARGGAFTLMGVYVIRAGLNASPGQSRGMGASLQGLEHQPGGSLILAAVAVGLLAFGLFGLMEARYREFRTA